MFSKKELTKVLDELNEKARQEGYDFDGDIFGVRIGDKTVDMCVDIQNITLSLADDPGTSTSLMVTDVNSLRWYLLAKTLSDELAELKHEKHDMIKNDLTSISGLKLVNAKYTKGDEKSV